jgi:hypothetical protein
LDFYPQELNDTGVEAWGQNSTRGVYSVVCVADESNITLKVSADISPHVLHAHYLYNYSNATVLNNTDYIKVVNCTQNDSFIFYFWLDFGNTKIDLNTTIYNGSNNYTETKKIWNSSWTDFSLQWRNN